MRESRERPITISLSVFIVGLSSLIAYARPPANSQSSEQKANTKADEVNIAKDDFVEKLVHGDEGRTDIMSKIIGRMADAELRLVRHYDAGTATQEIQRRIIDDLEQAISSSIRSGRSGSASESGGDIRRRPQSGRDGASMKKTGRSGRQKGGRADGAENGIANGDTTQRDDLRDARHGGPLSERRRGWGHLPQRDREEVLQGSREASLEKFRTWIDRYYELLAREEGD